MVRAIGRLVAFVWHQCRTSWVTAHEDLRPRSPASGLVLFLFVMSFIVGLLLVLLGVDLDRLDFWLADHAHQLDAVGSVLFRILCGLILAICACLIAGGVCQRVVPSMRGEDRIGIGLMIGAALVGYFAWFGVVG